MGVTGSAASGLCRMYILGSSARFIKWLCDVLNYLDNSTLGCFKCGLAMPVVHVKSLMMKAPPQSLLAHSLFWQNNDSQLGT